MIHHLIDKQDRLFILKTTGLVFGCVVLACAFGAVVVNNALRASKMVGP